MDIPASAETPDRLLSSELEPEVRNKMMRDSPLSFRLMRSESDHQSRS